MLSVVGAGSSVGVANAGSPLGLLHGQVKLSPTRAAASYGTTCRGYQRWSRIIRTVRSAVAGHDLTRAAIDAGFATPSHFSENFRDMIGLSATEMLRAGIRFDLGTGTTS